MKKPKRKISYHEHEEPKQFPDVSGVASASECTGLMPRPPRNEQEMEGYQELSSMAIPKKKPNK